MGPKKIKRRLYANQDIPTMASDEHVREVMLDLTQTLFDKLNQPYRWMAVAWSAVQAGTWGGERRRRSREKLLTMINKCRSFLCMTEWKLEKGWSSHNLHYGFGAVNSWSRESGQAVEMVIFEQFLKENYFKGG